MNGQSCGDPYPPFQRIDEPIVQNHWQLCPKCHGTGLVQSNSGWPFSDTVISTAPQICDICQGRKIISTINGLPPA